MKDKSNNIRYKKKRRFEVQYKVNILDKQTNT